MRFLALCVIPALVLLGGVVPGVRAEQAGMTNKDALFPLELGTLWKYQITELDEEGKTIRTRAGTSQVVGVHLIDGKRWFNVFEMGYGFWVRNTPLGMEEADISLDEETMQLKTRAPRLFFKYPAMKGETYDLDEELDDYKMVVTDVKQKVTVPAGTYECVVYDVMEGGEPSNRFYLAPGIGLVKFQQSAEMTESGRAEVIEMTSFTRP